MTEGASGEFADNLLIGWYLLITADTLCQFYEALPPIGIGKGMALRGTISGNQIGFAPAGSLRLGAAPQTTADCQSSATLFFQKTSKGVFQSRHFLGR